MSSTVEKGLTCRKVVLHYPYNMSMTFTKLFSSITESSVWFEPDHVRLAWITMLAMSDRKGRVWASIPGLAHRARIEVEQAQDAIKRFMEPDKYSRTKENEGRRIAEIDGGWVLLNYLKFRAIRDEESVNESKRAYINNRRASEASESTVEPCRTEVEQSRNSASASASPSESESESVLPKVQERGVGETVPLVSKHPTLDEIKLVTAKAGLPDSDAVYFFEHWQSNGWTNSGKPMKSWPHVIGSWKAAGHCPSQKANGQPRLALGNTVADKIQCSKQMDILKDRVADLKSRTAEQWQRTQNPELVHEREVVENQLKSLQDKYLTL